MEEETDSLAEETTSLLQILGRKESYNPGESLKYENVTEIRNQEQEEILRKLGLDFENLTYWRALSRIGVLTITSFIALLLEFGMDTINLYFIGKENNAEELAACGLGNAIGLYMLGSIVCALSIGLETLGSQAYGAQNFRLVGLWFNRGLLINILSSTILALLFCTKMDLILIYLGQNRKVAEGVGTYLRWSIPHVILYGTFSSSTSFMLIQQKVKIYFIVDALITPFHFFLAYLLISYFGLGLIGAALALDFSFLFGNLIFFTYMNCSKLLKESIVPLFRMENLEEWGLYLGKAIAGLFLLMPKFWGLLSLSILASYLGSKALASHSILLNTLVVLWSLTYASTIAVSVLVGNAFGYLKLSAIPLIYKAGFTLSLGSGLFLNGALLLLSEHYIQLMTPDDQIQRLVASLLPYVSLSSMLQQVIAVLEGILRGSGEQKRAAYFNPFIFLIHLPLLGYSLGFHANLSLLGVWVGYVITIGIVLLIYLIIVLNLDMEKILREIQAIEGAILLRKLTISFGSFIDRQIYTIYLPPVFVNLKLKGGVLKLFPSTSLFSSEFQ